MTIKQFVFQSLVGVVAAPIIVTGKAMIAIGDTISDGGYATMEFGAEKAVKWLTQASIAEQQAASKKAAAKLRHYQRKEAKQAREQAASRASGAELEAELV